ncbi:ADP-ribosyl cyclase/cyclic ADP-ribose hydrolase 1 isoform X2 [Lepus europaeus]|uniref:ADP-ribosyl cyclase/cyclic ADP-ribose hydrolase 1 isoform X2 n=1 Tax=Lepus europaeus TaxID=9983 RepID=UPI002B46B59F|nr:ADP-ribosyl cyclase/cyclic ADP-ribose hydrolase 1 isoform X2 [Lepus europaeus]
MPLVEGVSLKLSLERWLIRHCGSWKAEGTPSFPGGGHCVDVGTRVGSQPSHCPGSSRGESTKLIKESWRGASGCRNQDCKKILNAFTSAFVSKDPCSITKEDYQPLINLVTQTVPCNKTLFWSRSKELAHQYSGIQNEMFTLEDTLLGYIADDLVWCGDPRTSEVKEEFCPYRNENCSSTATSVFWTVVSQKFAESACGTVYVMLNGSGTTAFSKASTFGSVEVFNLHPDRVHTLHAWVMHDIGGVSRDSCLGSSIKELKSIVNQRNISFLCQDDYRPARFVQCVRRPEDPACSTLM